MTEHLEKTAHSFSSTFTPPTTVNTSKETPSTEHFSSFRDNKGKGSLLEIPLGKPETYLDSSGRTSFIKCYICNGVGRKSNVCPQRKEAHLCDRCEDIKLSLMA